MTTTVSESDHRQRKAGALQQPAHVADVGERRYARRGAAANLGLGRDPSFSQLRERCPAKQRGEQQTVRFQCAPHLHQRAR